MKIVCHQCGERQEVGERVGRHDDCLKCSSDLHVCLNCQYYDTTAYNQCQEVQAERVLEKTKANFCDYFSPRLGPNQNISAVEEAKKKLENLFKK